MKISSEAELVRCLNRLRASIQGFDYSTIENVIFISLESFYCFTNKISLYDSAGRTTVQELLDAIEPYIPVTVNAGNLDLFLNALLLDDDEMERLHESIQKKTKIEFINMVRNAKTSEDWGGIVSLITSVYNVRQKQQYYAHSF